MGIYYHLSDEITSGNKKRNGKTCLLQNARCASDILADIDLFGGRLVMMAFDYPNGTWTIASIPVLTLLLIAGWFSLRKRANEVAAAPIDVWSQEILFEEPDAQNVSPKELYEQKSVG